MAKLNEVIKANIEEHMANDDEMMAKQLEELLANEGNTLSKSTILRTGPTEVVRTASSFAKPINRSAYNG